MRVELAVEVFCVLRATHQTLGKPEHCSIHKCWLMLSKYIPLLQSKYLFLQRAVPFRGVKVENKDEAALVEWGFSCFPTPVNLKAFEVLLVVSLFLHRDISVQIWSYLS